MVNPYLPDIIEGVVARVSAAFQARVIDPFSVFFEKGIHPQVSRSIYKSNRLAPGSAMIWLEMPEKITFGNWRIFGEADVEMYLVVPTDNKFTQQQRDDLSFKPRLIPMYEVLMQEIKRERWFQNGYGSIRHTRILLPFWGMGAVGGVDKENAFGKQVDAIRVKIPVLPIKIENCTSGIYPINPNTDYQPSPYILAFFDDIELVVDGGGLYDPASGQGTVVIPSLAGMDYDVYQRGIGQLRQQKNTEFTKDINGGFVLTGGRNFSATDTYIIKVRPQYVENTGSRTGTSRNGLQSFFIENN